MTVLTGMTHSELKKWIIMQGYPGYRADQLFTWIHRGADFDQMKNLPEAMRTELKQNAVAQPVALLKSLQSELDGTVKLLYGLKDGNCVEGVLMHYHYGVSLCISTQVGCRMGCRFCASTLDGVIRNLSAGEMMGEILCANEFLRNRDVKVGHVVMMGSGEPLDNYDEVIRFLRLLRDGGTQISLRNVSLSTCGLVPKMYELADEVLPVTLCVSLHAPNDEIRKQIMPVANRYAISEIMNACRYYIRKTGRRVIIEYAMIDGINSTEKDADELAALLRGLQCHVNLIPLNDVKERNLKGVDERTVQSFLERLKLRHISATRRREMGDDIEGACGQLRRKSLNESARENQHA